MRDIEEIKTVPCVSLSHTFVERAIGSVGREYLDHMLFWSKKDLFRKLDQYKAFYNETRGHFSLKGTTPKQAGEKITRAIIPVDNYTCASNGNGLFNTPIAC
jgi:transposase InsO family protein